VKLFILLSLSVPAACGAAAAEQPVSTAGAAIYEGRISPYAGGAALVVNGAVLKLDAKSGGWKFAESLPDIESPGPAAGEGWKSPKSGLYYAFSGVRKTLANLLISPDPFFAGSKHPQESAATIGLSKFDSPEPQGKNYILAGASGEPPDACDPQQGDACALPPHADDYGSCGYGSWMGWTRSWKGVPAYQFIANVSAGKIIIYPGETVGIAPGAVVRDFLCHNGELPLFATGNKKGDGYAAGGSGGIAITRGGGQSYLSAATGLADNHVLDIEEHNGNLWLATMTGVQRRAASGGWTRWKFASAKAVSNAKLLAGRGSGWTPQSLAKGEVFRITASLPGWYCARTKTPITGWVGKAAVLREYRDVKKRAGHSVNPSLVQQQPVPDSPAGGELFDGPQCPDWRVKADWPFKNEGDWLETTANSALLPMPDAIPALTSR